MPFLFESGATVLGLFALMLALFELGRRVGRRRMQNDPAGSHSGVGALENAVFSLLGLLIAFTFFGAWSRFDARRDLLLKEANAMGTVWQRLDLLGAPAQAALRADLRHYVDLRLVATRAGADHADEPITAVQQAIWARAITATRDATDGRVMQLLLPAINDLFDVAAERYVAAQTHPPRAVYEMLVVIALVCALLAGYGMAGSKTRSWLHILSFIGSVLMAIYVTVEIEFPRRGLIRIDHYDQVLVDVRESMR